MKWQHGYILISEYIPSKRARFDGIYAMRVIASTHYVRTHRFHPIYGWIWMD